MKSPPQRPSLRLRPPVNRVPSANIQPVLSATTQVSDPYQGQNSQSNSNKVVFFTILGITLAIVVIGWAIIAGNSRPQTSVAPSANSGSSNANPRPTILSTSAVATLDSSRSDRNEQRPVWANAFIKVPERLMVVCVSSTNIHAGPGTSYPILGSGSRNEQWKVFGKVDDWFYIGYDEQKRDGFIYGRGLCEVSTPTLASPVRATTFATNKSIEPTISTSQPIKELSALQPIPRHGIPVCVPYAVARSSPDLGAPGVASVAKDGLYFIDGKIGDWYSGMVDPKTISPRTFVLAVDLCLQPDPSSTCDDFLFQKWKNGKSESYTKPCTAQE